MVRGIDGFKANGEQRSGRWRIQLPHPGGDGAGEGSIACREVLAYGPSATVAQPRAH